MKEVSQASTREVFDYDTVRSMVTGLGMIPKSLVTEIARGDAHRAGDYEVATRDFLLNEHVKRELKDWVQEKRKEKAPFSHGWSYFDRELLNLPVEVWDSGIAGILAYASITYDAWRQREGI